MVDPNKQLRGYQNVNPGYTPPQIYSQGQFVNQQYDKKQFTNPHKDMNKQSGYNMQQNRSQQGYQPQYQQTNQGSYQQHNQGGFQSNQVHPQQQQQQMVNVKKQHETPQVQTKQSVNSSTLDEKANIDDLAPLIYDIIESRYPEYNIFFM